jgi:hypothetical protein
LNDLGRLQRDITGMARYRVLLARGWSPIRPPARCAAKPRRPDDRAEAFSAVLLSVMEAIAQVARPDGVMALDLARVFDEATARTEARRALA